MQTRRMVDLRCWAIGAEPPGEIAERFFRVSMVILVGGIAKELQVSIILETLAMAAGVSVLTVVIRRLEMR